MAWAEKALDHVATFPPTSKKKIPAYCVAGSATKRVKPSKLLVKRYKPPSLNQASKPPRLPSQRVDHESHNVYRGGRSINIVLTQHPAPVMDRVPPDQTNRTADESLSTHPEAVGLGGLQQPGSWTAAGPSNDRLRQW